MSPQSTNSQKFLVLCAAAALIIWAAVYALRGQRQTDTVGGFDMHLRWVEEQYILRGRDPYRVEERWQREHPGKNPLNVGWEIRDQHEWHLGQPVLFRPDRIRDEVDPDLGPPGLGYPPWAYFTGVLFLWPPWDWVGFWYALVNVGAILVVCFWIWDAARDLPSSSRFLMIAAVLIVASLRTTLRFGQYGAIVVASLGAAQMAMERKRPVLAGILFAIAMTKPTIAAPFLIVPLVMKKWTTVAAAAGYLAVASVLVWAYVGTDPLTMLKSMLAASSGAWSITGPNPVRWLKDLGVETQLALRICAVTGIAVGTALLVRFRQCPVDVLFAIAALASRFWTYHKTYDDVVLIFLLVPIAHRALARFEPGWCLLAAVLGLSLWTPSGLEKVGVPFHVFQCVTWISSLALLLWSAGGTIGTPALVERPNEALA